MARTGPGSGRSFGDAENARLRAIAERVLRECDGARIWYRWHPSARVRGSRVFHGLGHCGFAAAGWRRHTEADAWHLCAELALQTDIADALRTVAEARRVQSHASDWLLRAQMRRAGLILVA